ncbi:MAG: nucleotidyltransferase family protein [Clostridiales bacterium]|nr:nucleotidyltransferase family protein [Clostridiales bacterium]
MGYTFPMLPPLANGLVLLAHLWAHLHGGLGIRQFIDWMLYVDKVLDDDFWEKEFKTAAQELGIDILAITATRMCQIYLGLNDRITWCQYADEDLCKELMGILLSSGNFGRRQVNERLVESIFTVIRKEGLFHYLQTAGEKNWNAYKRHSWLKPFCWAYQICRYGCLGIKTKRMKDLNKGIVQSKTRADILKQLNIF